MSHALEVIDLWKGFAVGVRGCSARVSVLRGVSFHVGDGEHLGIVGGRGAGKTTLLHCIVGLRSPDAGLVRRADGAESLLLVEVDAPPCGPRARALERSALFVARDAAWLAGRVDRLLLLRDGRLAPLDVRRDAAPRRQRVAEPRE